MKLALLLLASLPAFAGDPTIFAYSKAPANSGVFLAVSTDGLHWTALNGGKAWLPGEGMRDPLLTRGPEGEFHLRWTRRGNSFAYAHSPDLVHWSEQQDTPVSETPGEFGPVTVQIGSDSITSKHGNFLKIGAEEMNLLAATHGSVMAAMTASLPDLYHDEKYGDPPYLAESGWKPLLDGKDLSGWHADGGASSDWFTSTSVEWRRVFSPTHLSAKAASGDRIVNGKEGKTANLVTDGKFGSFELYLEFLLAKGSNSGVFLHGLYEIQVFDSYGWDGPLTVGDCGGIYEQEAGGGGSPPARNAARSPGEWQSLRIWFQGGQFDSSGKMMAKPKVMRVLLNGVLVQGEFTLPGPTLSHMNIAEAAKGPLMLQGDHGPVAYRNIWIKELD